MPFSEQEARVLAKIDELEPELIKVALDLGDMMTAQPHEGVAAQYVYDWHRANGFDAKKLGAPERFNVLAKHAGTGKGRTLLFASHMDNETRENVQLRLRHWDEPIYTHAWREGDTLVGHGIANDRGPMVCFMIAAKAIKESGVKLPGHILMASVLGETGGAPIDEFQGYQWDSHELGARYVATHGGMADFALIAEATNFTICPVECGFAYFKVTLYAEPASYTPFFPYPEPAPEKSVSALVRMSKFVERFQQYAVEYMNKYRYTFDGGEVVPKTVIGCIRGGVPYMPHITPEVCHAYIDFRTPPGLDPLVLQRDLEGLLAELGMEGKVENWKYLPGFEAWKVKDYDIFRETLTASHIKLFNKEPAKKSITYMNSMWRDINSWNELGVPAITYSFPTGYSVEGAAYSINLFRVKIKDMVDAAKVYALLALDLCSRPV